MKLLVTFATASLLLATSCGDAKRQSIRMESYQTDSIANTAAASNSGTGSGSGSGSGYGGGGGGGKEERNSAVQPASLTKVEQTHAQTNRKIIRNAEIGLEADSPEELQKQITSIAESKGGFVVESQQSSSDVRSTTRDVVAMTLRVPSENFDSALDEIRKIAKRVVVETVKGQDVTEEFIDIEAQLKAKKALEEQFMQIMKRANTVEEALDVQRQLAEVRGEIERIEGRWRFLENQSALSTIRVQIKTPAAISASSEGFGYRFTESFGNGVDIALNFILGLVTLVIGIIPFALFIGLPAFLIGRHFWRKHNRPKSVTEIAEDEINE